MLALPVVALGAWAVAQAVLFKLYLPHRYTYPLLAFFAIVVAVTLEPTWRALAARRGPVRAFALLASPVAICAFAVYVFPLAPVEPARPLATMALIGAVALALAAAAVAAVAAVGRDRGGGRPACCSSASCSCCPTGCRSGTRVRTGPRPRTCSSACPRTRSSPATRAT